VWGTVVLLAWLAAAIAGCGGGGGYDGPSPAERDPAPAPPPGATPVGVELLYLFENERGQPYFPFEGLAGVAWGEDGTLIVCDESRGKVHGLDPRSRTWTEFDRPGVRPYRPVDAVVDGFKVLILDIGSRALFRHDLDGIYQDRIVNFEALDPAYDTVPAAFDIDLDGRLVVADGGEEQVLLLDAFLALQSRVGGPGPHREQFSEPSGVVFTTDGGFVVADRGNRRLQRFNRLGYWEATWGGPFDADNPFVAPQGLARDRWGNVFVADPPLGVVHVLDARGELLLDIGPGLDLAATPLGPVDVALGPDQQLVVSDRLRGAVLVYRILYE
jgi:sugar lactone lactonase YvrE